MYQGFVTAREVERQKGGGCSRYHVFRWDPKETQKCVKRCQNNPQASRPDPAADPVIALCQVAAEEKRNEWDRRPGGRLCADG